MKNYYMLKDDYENDIVIIKKGSFYYYYFEDAYILNYLFHYKLLKTSLEKNTDYVVFPNIDKVTRVLKKNQIGYVIYDGSLIDREYGESLIYNKYINDSLEYLGKKKIIEKLVIFLYKLDLNELEKRVLCFYD